MKYLLRFQYHTINAEGKAVPHGYGEFTVEAPIKLLAIIRQARIMRRQGFTKENAGYLWAVKTD